MSNVKLFKGRDSFENVFDQSACQAISRFLKDIKGDSFCVLNEIGNNSYNIARWKTEKKLKKRKKERERARESKTRGILSSLHLLKTYAEMITSAMTTLIGGCVIYLRILR